MSVCKYYLQYYMAIQSFITADAKPTNIQNKHLRWQYEATMLIRVKLFTHLQPIYYSYKWQMI